MTYPDREQCTCHLNPPCSYCTRYTGDQGFDLWIQDLYIYARTQGFTDLTETTGVECWKEYWEDGHEPKEAFDLDMA